MSFYGQETKSSPKKEKDEKSVKKSKFDLKLDKVSIGTSSRRKGWKWIFKGKTDKKCNNSIVPSGIGIINPINQTNLNPISTITTTIKTKTKLGESVRECQEYKLKNNKINVEDGLRIFGLPKPRLPHNNISIQPRGFSPQPPIYRGPPRVEGHNFHLFQAPYPHTPKMLFRPMGASGMPRHVCPSRGVGIVWRRALNQPHPHTNISKSQVRGAIRHPSPRLPSIEERRAEVGHKLPRVTSLVPLIPQRGIVKFNGNIEKGSSDGGSGLVLPTLGTFKRALDLHKDKDKKSVKNVNCLGCSKILDGKLFARPLTCHICDLLVCTSCALWDKTTNAYSCPHCHPPKRIDQKKNYWFEDISHPQNFICAEEEKGTLEVREHLEGILERHLNAPIDSVSLAKLYKHPQYELLFHAFHSDLSDALMNLAFSLKLAIQNKGVNEDPTSAHNKLRELLSEIKERVMDIPQMEPLNHTSTNNKNNSNSSLNNNNSDKLKVAESGGGGTYEDALATALLNKAIQNSQLLRGEDKGKESPSLSQLSLVDSAVQTDSELSEHSETTNKYNVGGWIRNLDEERPSDPRNNESEDDLSLGTSSSNWSHQDNEINNKLNNQTHQLLIEEEVEEITTTTYESDSDANNPQLAPLPPRQPIRVRKGRKSHRQRNSKVSSVLNGHPLLNVQEIEERDREDALIGIDLNVFESRATFPESGVDIVGQGNLREDDPTGTLVSQISEWEHNWLFKRRKDLLRRRNLMAEAVPMLVPNPNQIDISPQIGEDNISDLSELSDHVDNDSEDDQTENEEEEIDEENVQSVHLTPSLTCPSEPLTVNGTNVVTESKKLQPKIVKTKPKIEIEMCPKDTEVCKGRTARVVCQLKENAPQHSVAWFCSGQLLTSKEGKIWICSHKSTHYLYIYSVDDEEGGDYSISIFDYKGNETKYKFKIIIKRWEGSKGEAPNFTLLTEQVEIGDSERILNIPFQIRGHPEPCLTIHKNEVEITKLPHVLLEDLGEGKWDLCLRLDETRLGGVEGEYVAMAKNTNGSTRVTFIIVQNGEGGVLRATPIFNNKTEKMRRVKEGSSSKRESNSPLVNGGLEKGVGSGFENRDEEVSSPSRPISVLSEGSSIGETLRESSHTLNGNETMIKEDYEAALFQEREERREEGTDGSIRGGQERSDDSRRSSVMSIAEREKLKWANPVTLSNNPYAPENLQKRIQASEGRGSFTLPQSTISSGDCVSSEEEPSLNVRRTESLKKFSRDYYVGGGANNFVGHKSWINKNKEGGSSLNSNSSKDSKDSLNINEGEIKKREDEKGFKREKKEEEKMLKNKVGGSPVPTSQTRPPHSNEKVIRPRGSNQIVSTNPDPGDRSSTRAVNKKSSSGDLKQIQLPSVKQLAQQFQVIDEGDKVVEVIKKPTNPNLAARLMQREKSGQQVHSLTARSVSREFREGLKLQKPNVSDINVKLKAKVEGSSFSQKDENLNKSTINPEDKGINNNSDNKIKNNLSPNNEECHSDGTVPHSNISNPNNNNNNILARAAFWDKRVEDKILIDQHIIHHFPKLN